MRPIHLAGLVLLSLIWGASFMMMKVMLEEMSPLAVAWLRLAGGGLFIAAVLFAMRQGVSRSRVFWRDVSVVALLATAVPFVLIPWGQQQIPSNLGAILNGAMPIWAAILSVLFLPTERFTRNKGIGIGMGFLGLAIIIGPDALDVRSGSTQGQFAIVLAALCYASGAVFTRRRLLGVNSSMLAGAQNAVALLMLTPLLLASGDMPDLGALEGRTLLATAGLAFLSQGVAILVYFWLLSNVEATQASFVTYLAPLAAQFWGWAVLGEVPAMAFVPGLALIIGGIVVANRRPASVQVMEPVPERVAS